MDANTLVWLMLLLPLVSAAGILLFFRKLHNVAAFVSTISVIATFVFAVLLLGVEEGAEVVSYSWLDLGEVFRAGIGGMEFRRRGALDHGLKDVLTHVLAAVSCAAQALEQHALATADVKDAADGRQVRCRL